MQMWRRNAMKKIKCKLLGHMKVVSRQGSFLSKDFRIWCIRCGEDLYLQMKKILITIVLFFFALPVSATVTYTTNNLDIGNNNPYTITFVSDANEILDCSSVVLDYDERTNDDDWWDDDYSDTPWRFGTTTDSSIATFTFTGIPRSAWHRVELQTEELTSASCGSQQPGYWTSYQFLGKSGFLNQPNIHNETDTFGLYYNVTGGNSTTTVSSEITIADDPTRNIYYGLTLFFIMFFGLLYYFKKS